MRRLLVLSIIVFPTVLMAQTSASEQALILNDEMNYLLNSATSARVYSAPDTTAAPDNRLRRNGPAPSQMPGVERLEDRYFSDEVSVQAAASDRITPEAQESSAYDEEAREDGYRVDGTMPKKR